MLLLFLSTGDASDLGGGDFLDPIISVLFGVNLWRGKEDWPRYTVWWAAIGLVIFGGGALLIGDWVSLIAQIAYSGSLILLLAGTPTKGRMIMAVILFAVGYIGLILGFFALSFLAGLFGAI